MSDTTQILDKIQKLFRLANNEAATEGEIQAALGRAAHLAAKHNISDVEIEKATRQDGTEGVRLKVRAEDMVDESIHSAAKVTRWDKILGQVVALATTTGCYIGWDRGFRAIRLYGLPADVAVARELFTFARRALFSCSKRWAKEQREEGYQLQSGSVEIRTYKDGFCSGLYHSAQMEADKRRDDREERAELTVGECTALVVVSDITEAKETALVARAATLGLKKSARRKIAFGGHGAYEAGESAGRSTNLGRNTVSG